MTNLEKQLGRINRFFDQPVGQQFLPDLATIIGPTQVDDGHDGHSIQDDELLTDIKCLVEDSGGNADANEDAVNATKTCRIHLKLTEAQALLIDEHKKIKIDARGFNPEMIFEQPVRVKDSLSQLVIVTAILTSGFRRPGTQ